MIIFRTYSAPEIVQHKDGSVCWMISVLTDDDEVDACFFKEEGHAWAFYHDVNGRFDPLEVDNEEEEDEG